MIEGTEQRVYGVLIGDCYVNLHRFALVYGDKVNNPDITTSTVIYGDSGYSTSYNADLQKCAYKHTGFGTIFFSYGNGNQAFLGVEFAYCKKQSSFIVYTYLMTDNYSILPDDISVWFNDKSIVTPSWTLLNSGSKNTALEEVRSEFNFTGDKKDDTYLDVKNCRSCTEYTSCVSCNINSRFVWYVGTGTFDGTLPDPGDCPHSYGNPGVRKLGYGYKGYGEKSLIAEDGGGGCWDTAFEYTLECDKIKIWAYTVYSHDFTHKLCYIDDNGTEHLIAEGRLDEPTLTYAEFPFDFTLDCLPRINVSPFQFIDMIRIQNNSTGRCYIPGLSTNMGTKYIKLYVTGIDGTIYAITGEVDFERSYFCNSLESGYWAYIYIKNIDYSSTLLSANNLLGNCQGPIGNPTWKHFILNGNYSNNLPVPITLYEINNIYDFSNSTPYSIDITQTIFDAHEVYSAMVCVYSSIDSSGYSISPYYKIKYSAEIILTSKYGWYEAYESGRESSIIRGHFDGITENPYVFSGPSDDPSKVISWDGEFKYQIVNNESYINKIINTSGYSYMEFSDTWYTNNTTGYEIYNTDIHIKAYLSIGVGNRLYLLAGKFKDGVLVDPNDGSIQVIVKCELVDMVRSIAYENDESIIGVNMIPIAYIDYNNIKFCNKPFILE